MFPPLPSCPRCRYDLSGLPGSTCPECGLAITPELIARRRPSPRLFRSTQAAIVIAPTIALGDLFVHGPALWHHPEWRAFAAAAGSAVAATALVALWARWQSVVQRMPGYQQARIATAAWALLALIALATFARP